MAVLTFSYHDFLDDALEYTLLQLTKEKSDTPVVIDFTNVYPSGLSTQPKPCPVALVHQLLPNLKQVLGAQQQKNAIDKVEIWKADDSKSSTFVLKAQVKAGIAIVGSAMLAFFREPGWLVMTGLAIIAGSRLIIAEKKAAGPSVECAVFNTALLDIAKEYKVSMINGQKAIEERAIALTELPAIKQYSANSNVRSNEPDKIDTPGCYPIKNT